MHYSSCVALLFFSCCFAAGNHRFLRTESKTTHDRHLAPSCSTSSNYTSCQSVSSCIWIRGLCRAKTSWLGYAEVGQTHVVRAQGETRHAPRIIADREAELLFFPTEEAQPTMSPSAAPSATIDHVFGLEQLGYFSVDLPSANAVWPSGYPTNPRLLLDDIMDAYYFPASTPDVNLNFDLHANRAVQGVYVMIWYYSRIDSLKIGLRPDDGADINGPADNTVPDSQWMWIDGGSHTSGLNKEILIPFKLSAARYVQIRIRGGWRGSAHTSSWGLRRVQISGSLDGSIVDGPGDNEITSPVNGEAFFPGEAGDVLVEAYDASGGFLGRIKARPTSQQRGIMDQLDVSEKLTPYSDSREMWSSTLPWNWVKHRSEFIISAKKFDGTFVSYGLKLHDVVPWSEHTLIRQKFVVFGNESQFNSLDTSTFESEQLAVGMYGIMPVASLNWVDASVLHWPYLVVSTSNGARKVASESERRAVLLAAGDSPTDEPTWDVTKNMIAFRSSYANTGRGFTITTLEASGEHGSPYSTQTSIAMGWAMVNDGFGCSLCQYKSLGYWDGWSAAASLGWCGMKSGDECGNTISHEIGHSMTLNHFTTGTAADWGISDEYPEDGTHLATHPWGFDSPSRQFRTWYNPIDGSSKYDPMNGGGDPTKGSCFNYYTAYHAQKSQNWGVQSPQILSSDTSNVPSDGLYQFNSATKSLIKASPETRFMAPVETGIPVVTFIGTLGSDTSTCQTYPPSLISYGHTFRFPDPFTNGLEATFIGAAYAVEVLFANGSSEWALIASPDLRNSKELRLFSFNVAISRKPTTIKLYRFDAQTYPSLTLTSAKTLLHIRAVNLPADPTTKINQVAKTGRGWLGHSGDVRISKLCVSEKDCGERKVKISWRGADGNRVSFAPLVSHSSHATGSSLIFKAKSVQDGTTHNITVRAARFVADSGWFPMLSAPPSGQSPAPDATHGIAFWIPHDANSKLPHGSYTAIAPVASGTVEESEFVKIRINLQLTVPLVTDVANLSSKAFTSKKFTTKASSIYFLAEDPTIGPTNAVWWGESRATLSVPLIAYNCKNAEVVASVMAQNNCDDYDFFQMNAGRGANDCSGHSLYLSLDDVNANPWRGDSAYQGCRFETHPAAPIQINAYRWHEPNGGALLGSMNIKVLVDVPLQLAETANLHLGKYTSRSYVNGTNTIYFLTTNSSIGPTQQVFSGKNSSTLSLPLQASNCANKKITAKILAQNKCGSFLTQMNARKGVTNCGGNKLVLTLGNATINSWVTKAANKMCKFETPQLSPLRIKVFRWNAAKNTGEQIGSMNIPVVVDVSKMTK